MATPARRRRLSGVGGKNTPMTEANDDEVERRQRRRKKARRKSAKFTPMKDWGNKENAGRTNEQVSSEISAAIKMHTQNKISERNAFALPLASMLREGADGKFERASVILEAGTLIYGKRVDCTLQSTFKVRDSLFRSGKNDGRASRGGRGGSDADDADAGGGARSRASKKAGVVSTLEKRVANITCATMAQEFELDPLFHKMSLIATASGAKGMLLNNLPVRSACKIVFDSSGTQQGKKKATQAAAPGDGAATAAAVMDVSSFAAELHAKVKKAGRMPPLCPGLAVFYGEQQHYMAQLGRGDHDSGLAADEDEDESSGDDGQGGGGGGFEDVGFDMEMEMDMGDMTAPADMMGGRLSLSGQDPSLLPLTPSNIDAEARALHREAMLEQQQGGGSGIDGEVSSFHGRRATGNSDKSWTRFDEFDIGLAVQASGGSDYTFFDPSLRPHFNLAAARRRRAAKQRARAEDGAGDEGTGKRGRKKGPKRARFSIDFSAPLTAEEALKLQPPKRAASTQLTSRSKARPSSSKSGKGKRGKTKKKGAPEADAAAQSKQVNLLPQDPHFKAAQLSQLFLNPDRRVRACRGVVVDADQTGDGGEAVSRTLGFGGFDAGMGGGDDDDDFDDDDHGAGMDMDMDMNFDASGELGEGQAGDGSGAGAERAPPRIDLVAAEHQVQRIDVKYATVAKRVDVGKLKKEIWQLTEKRAPSTAEVLPEAGAEKEVGAEESGQSFTATMGTLRAKVPDNITVPFYFICMLHLANEKGLKLEQRSDQLDDFRIFQDASCMQLE